jgi:hypothetical protein
MGVEDGVAWKYWNEFAKAIPENMIMNQELIRAVVPPRQGHGKRYA